MSLFKKPEQTRIGVKVLGFGATGVGKTKFSLTFPKVAAIDSESGMGFYKEDPNLVLLHQTTSAEEVEDALDEIEDELINEIETFVLDSETKIYENLQHSALDLVEKRARTKGQDVQDANLSQREWGKIKLINKRIQATKIKLSSLGVNVVSIAQEKEIKEKRGDNWIVTGYEPDVAKGLSFDYDVVIRFFTKEEKGEVKYYGQITKDRTGTFKRGDIVENPTYDMWRNVVDKTKGLKVEVVDFKKDIEKDVDVIEAEIDKIENLVEKITAFMKKYKDADKEKLRPLLVKAREFGLTNPTKVEDFDQAQALAELCE